MNSCFHGSSNLFSGSFDSIGGGKDSATLGLDCSSVAERQARWTQLENDVWAGGTRGLLQKRDGRADPLPSVRAWVDLLAAIDCLF
jgi:hypothetical protein